MSSLQTIQAMMVKQFDLKLEDLTPDATLEGLGLDSLSVIEFTFPVATSLLPCQGTLPMPTQQYRSRCD